MSTINDLLKISPEQWLMFMVILFLLIFAIPTVHDQIVKFLNTLGLVSTRIIKKNEYEKRMDKIENDIVELHNDVKELNQNIKNLTEMFNEHAKQDKESKVAMLRNNLWTIYREAEEQNYITNEGLKTFIELGKVYERNGGDDIYHEKLYPTVMSLEVR